MTKYIWHTMGDNHVRSEHAARNGQIFDFDNPPEGGNPGDAPNCRCWAEPIEEEEQNKDFTAKKLAPIVPDTPIECIQKDEIAIEKAYDILIKPDVENRVEYVYYDTKGIPTIGVGINVEQKSVFMNLSLLHASTMRPLTMKEKTELYHQVIQNRPILKKGEIYNIKAKDQDLFKPYIIDDNEQYHLAHDHLQKDLRDVKNKFAKHGINYAEVPPSAIAGALEICYNRGRTGFEEFNKFMDLGIKQRDYEAAYEQSHRENMPVDRYKAIRKFYDDAEREMQRKENYGFWE